MIGMNLQGSQFDAIAPEITHIRLWDCGVHWGAIHIGPDTYDWTLLDSLVAKCGDRHITYVIAGTPRWLAKDPNQGHYAPWLGQGSNSLPFSVDEFNKFVWNLATRYRGKIRAYEVWNEPQLVDFLYPYNDAECNALATMTKRAYATIKSCDPAALVLSAAVLPRASSGGMTRARKYLAALQRRDWNVDAFSTHIYPEVGYWAPRWRSMLADVVSTLRTMGTPTSKLWITETLIGLLGPELTDDTAIDTAIEGIYEAANGRFVFLYAWDRPDLGGMRIASGTQAWTSIKARHAT